MNGDKTPDFRQRQNDAAAAKKTRLEKFRSAIADPAVVERAAARAALIKTREARTAARIVAKKLREAGEAEVERRKTELASQIAREAEAADIVRAAETSEREAAVAAEQKALRDARYVARKAAKKQRRKG
jgi:hypothetical protein